MRLSCPNCGAQYEVPLDVIPQAGRDVQCSNCGHTWFQVHPDEDVELAEEVGGSTPDQGWSPEDSTPEDTIASEEAEDPSEDPVGHEVQPPEIEIDVPDEDEDVSAPVEKAETHTDERETAEEASEPEPERTRKPLDSAVTDILREEAEYEAQAREAEEASPLETQPDLGLQQPENESDKRAAQARDRMRRIRGLSDQDDVPETPAEQETAAQQTEDAAHHSRRDLLPDIEEINSTLRSDGKGSGTSSGSRAEPTAASKRRGFRLGFAFVVLVAAGMIAVYAYNDKIVTAYPQAEPYISMYMERMNEARVWLDTLVTDGMLWLNEKAASAGGNVD